MGNRTSWSSGATTSASLVFAEQRCQGTLRTWAEQFTLLREPKLFNLRTDPFEYADITSNAYY
ncbi:MAG: hypothetical protein ACXWZX_09555 [Mycobacterium sp.]